MEKIILLYQLKIKEYDRQIKKLKEKGEHKKVFLLKINRNEIVKQYNKIKNESYELV
tara:strand:- start:789 stop:959 length:171 start_codon:yes stop_codon:yes gene_type:complete